MLHGHEYIRLLFAIIVLMISIGGITLILDTI